jgi:ketosteroid isomerase-like protein
VISESEVMAFLKVYEVSANSRDFAKVAEMIHPDATYRFTDGDFVGREAIRGAFEKTWAYNAINERYWLTDVKLIYCDSSSACLSYDFHWTGVGTAGPFHTKGRGTQLIVRNGGKLQSIYEHLGGQAIQADGQRPTLLDET